MSQLLGEYDCKIDVKGRMRLPAMLLKQLEGEMPHVFILNRGFEKCLMLYPEKVWDKLSEDVNQLNLYTKKNRAFVRYFYRGATKVTTDSTDRILMSKRLLSYAGIGNEAILFAYNDRMEVWDKEAYEMMIDEEPMDFSDLAEEVMGGEELRASPGTGWTSDG